MPKAWKEITVPRQIITGATCDHCGATLKPVMTDDTGEVISGFEGASTITLTGSDYGITLTGSDYGEAFDGGPDPSGILCSECTQIALKTFPFLSRQILEFPY